MLTCCYQNDQIYLSDRVIENKTGNFDNGIVRQWLPAVNSLTLLL